jgi:signal transduction histidine kinase
MKSTSSQITSRLALQQKYQGCLSAYLDAGSPVDLESAREIGREAIALKLDTLDLARIHESSLMAISSEIPGGNGAQFATKAGGGRDAELAGVFFAEALTLIEQTHRAARENGRELERILKALSRRTLELTASNGQLLEEIRLRKDVEESLLISQQEGSMLLGKSLAMQDELRLLSRQLLSVQEEERRKISRELHDVIAQTLTIINLQLATLKAKAVANTDQLDEEIGKTQFAVQAAVETVHRFALELRPAVLDDVGLIPALESYLRSFRLETGIRVSLSASAQIEECDTAQRTVFYRVAQESLTNVRKHANAVMVHVKITCEDAGYTMTIADDGQGFLIEANGQAKAPSRLGFLGMRERTEMVGGTLLVESAPASGTKVTAFIPRNPAAKAHSKNPRTNP